MIACLSVAAQPACLRADGMMEHHRQHRSGRCPMLYEEYDGKLKQVAALVDETKYDQALAILKSLIDSDISDIDKSMMSVNVAVVYDKKGLREHALEWYDRGISFEAIYFRCFVAENKASYLFQLKRYKECLAIYEELLLMAYQTEVDKLRLQQNIEATRQAMK